MTVSLFARLWGACSILILLVVELSWPWDVVRRWLARAPHLGTNDTGTAWRIVNTDGSAAHPETFPTRKAAAAHLRESDRVKSWAADLTGCPWCFGGWATLGAVLVFAEGNGWDRAGWWGLLWLAASGTVVVLDAIAEAGRR